VTKTATGDDFILPRQNGRIMRGMEHYAPRKYRGPETWALVRDAYLSGEPAKLVCQRFDVSYANLRAKASREGWTRRAYAGATDVTGVRRTFVRETAGQEPPPTLEHHAPISRPDPEPAPQTPRDALQAGMARASQALAAGRAQEATAILKATETFARLNGEAVDGLAKPSGKNPKAEEQKILSYLEQIWNAAEELSICMMSDDRAHIHPAWASRNIYAWRAEHFGPEVAAADYAEAKARGPNHHFQIWDENGVLYPPTPRGQIPLHMQSMFAHYGPNKTRKYPEGTEDEL